MGNCAIKPKVLKDSEEDLVPPVERETVVPPDPADQKAAARRSDKGKEILIEDDGEDTHHKRPSLAHLFHEDKTVVEKEVADLSPPKRETNIIIGPSSEVSKLDTCASNFKVPQETFDVQTRNDLEVKIPKDSKVKKTPETPKAKVAEETFSNNLQVQFPVELEAKKTSQVVKVGEESKRLPEADKVSAPQFSELEVTKESSVPEVLEDKNIPKDSEVSVPELSEIIKVKKELDVPEVIEDKDIPQVSKVNKADEVEVAESELPKVSQVESTEDLEIKVPKIFESMKSSETSNINVKNESEVKTDQEALKANIEKETDVPEFKDAQEKLAKSDEDKDIVFPNNTEEETKDVSLEKQDKESTSLLSDLGNKSVIRGNREITNHE